MSEPPTKRLLLIVEDNPGDVRFLREMVGDHHAYNTEVTQVDRMSEAEAHLAEHAVDVILLDLGLPDAHGLEAVRRARAAAPHVPLLVLTGLDDETVATQALQQGAQDYLIKGEIDSRGLGRALRYAIERKILEDANRTAQTQLLQGQKLESIGRLAGGIAHDFNNMLFAIHGYAELLTEDLASADPARRRPDGLLLNVNAITMAADRASALTAQLLAFSRHQVVTMNVLDINVAVRDIEPMVRPLIGENLKLDLVLDPSTGHIRADRGQIDQILLNLIVNARDAMPHGGTVTIETSNVVLDERYAAAHVDATIGSHVLIAVTDTGMGMNRATREHMFEPFFTTKPVGKGTGLGLATTYGIVNQAGGHIRVDSELGKGSSFNLYFPRVDAGLAEEPVVARAALVGTGRVLVVEDERVVRTMISQFLERAGYNVVAVADAFEAIDAARFDPPIDVLVTDIVMPKMSGIALAEQMMERYPQIGTVLLSGYAAENVDLARITAQGARFVPKPVNLNTLLQAVLEAVDLRRAVADAS